MPRRQACELRLKNTVPYWNSAGPTQVTSCPHLSTRVIVSAIAISRALAILLEWDATRIPHQPPARPLLSPPDNAVKPNVLSVPESVQTPDGAQPPSRKRAARNCSARNRSARAMRAPGATHSFAAGSDAKRGRVLLRCPSAIARIDLDRRPRFAHHCELGHWARRLGYCAGCARGPIATRIFARLG